MTNIQHTISVAMTPDWLAKLCLSSTSPNPKTELLNTTNMFRTGSRNSTLTSIAGSLRRKGMSEHEIEMALSSINSTLPEPLANEEVYNIARSIGNREISLEGFTHDDFAKYLVRKFDGNVLYCLGQGFYIYNGRHWKHDTEGLSVIQIARELVSEIYAYIDNQRGKIDPEANLKMKKAASKLKSADFITKAIKLVKSEPSIQVSSQDFDQNKHLINLMNGTYDLHTGELRPYNAADRLNYIQDYSYDKDADCPTFKGLLTQVLDEDQAEYLVRVVGYALAGLGVERRFYILYGRGKNAKSTVMDALSSIFGPFAVTVQPETLNGSMSGQIRNDLARLQGARLMITSETKAGSVIDAPLLKQITGGSDKLTARFLHQEYVEFKPICVPFIVSNYKPVIDGSDAAIGSRICLMHFRKTIENPDVNFSAKLHAEKSGIFNLVLKGSAEYKKLGLNPPSSIQSETDNFVNASNLIRNFIDDCLTTTDEGGIAASYLYTLYQRWASLSGYRAMSNNVFKDAFERETNSDQRRSSAGHYWPGYTHK